MNSGCKALRKVHEIWYQSHGNLLMQHWSKLAPCHASRGFGSSAETMRGIARWGLVSIPEGKRYAVWNRFTGVCKQLDGPRQLWSSGALIDPLTLHKAGPDEYLTISLQEGGVEYIKGPASTWEDPIRHAHVKVQKKLQVDSNECIVVYRESATDDGNSEIKRTVLMGPLLYAPSGLEWMHRFSWHGTSRETLDKPIQIKLPGRLQFEKLNLAPDQIYFDVPNVRTRDDALLTVKVMIFTKLVDIERMLDTTLDPISEFINSLAADVLEFCGGRIFEDFKSDLDSLNVVGTYPNLASRASWIGYEVSKVVFRGYIASSQLQQMHDEAIYKRTELVLQKETQEQEQDLKDFKLDRDSLRAERLADFRLRRAQERQTMEQEKVKHQEEIEDLQASARLQRDLRRHEQALRTDKEEHEQKLCSQRLDHACSQEHYGALQRLGVDLSRYLAVVARGPAQRVIEVDTGRSDGASPQMHIHSKDGD